MELYLLVAVFVLGVIDVVLGIVILRQRKESAIKEKDNRIVQRHLAETISELQPPDDKGQPNDGPRSDY